VLTIEGLSYFLAPLPFAADFLATGRPPAGARHLAVDAVLGVVILALALRAHRTRLRTDRIDGLRKTMNEAVIHDLKNPMTSVMGCVSCALEDDLGAEHRKKLLSLALHGCRAQMTLLETLVDTNRLEQGELAIEKRDLDAARLLDECLRGVEGTATYLGVKLRRDVSSDFPALVRADADLFPRAILNLLHNAVKYTPPGGDVSLRAFVEGGRPQFEVRDTGLGIPRDRIGRLFEKYYRVEGGDQTGRRGSGLGLYFCRMVIEAHGGAIRVASAMGEGTTIRFDLPAPV
jgi:signal transduction histidine kinase